MKPKSSTKHRGLIIFVLGLCAVGGLLTRPGYSQSSPCVDCDKNKSQLNGDRRSSSDPRRVVDVKIDNITWGAQTPANLWNSTRGDFGPGALSAWNAVGSPYYFDHRQDIPNSQADFLIVRMPNWDVSRQGCAMTGTPVAGQSNTQRIIYLPPQAANWSQADLACILAHEIGHGIGLAGSYPPCQSIMTEPPVQSLSDCKCNGTMTQTQSPITANDVAKTNQFAENAQANCGKDGKKVTNFGTPGGGFTDPNPYRYYPTCYYYYDAVDVYYCALISVQDGSCHPETPPEYIGTIYILTDVFCF